MPFSYANAKLHESKNLLGAADPIGERMEAYND